MDVSFQVTSTVQAAADAGASNTWLGIRVNSAHEADSEYYKQFADSPVLDVTYNTKPAIPSGMTLSNCSSRRVGDPHSASRSPQGPTA